jgi:hypothetical protein
LRFVAACVSLDARIRRIPADLSPLRKEIEMKKKVRMTFLTLAAVLVYFATEQVGLAGCEPECWEVGGGFYCCTDARCIDYCF